jgi:predicted dinucleotide-binding enzyme
MKFGFIGAGEVAQIYAKHFVRDGHEVVLSNSRGPDSLIELARSIGPNARAGTVKYSRGGMDSGLFKQEA